MTIPQLEGLQIEVKAEGKGTRETQRGKLHPFGQRLLSLELLWLVWGVVLWLHRLPGWF